MRYYLPFTNRFDKLMVFFIIVNLICDSSASFSIENISFVDLQYMEELKPILCRAAVAYEPKKPMVIEEIWVDPPKAGEVRIKVISNALCHTDVYELDGGSGAGSNWPCILGHEATAIVESIGEGVTRVKVGDIIIPCYTPECMKKRCLYCESDKTNLCPTIRDFQGKGLMPDGTTRFRNKEGKPIFHFMGCSTFSEYSVIAEISAAKINPRADLNKVCMIGCGVSTGWGAAMNTSNVQAGSTVAVWGLGAVGLATIQACKIKGASKIYAIDINDKKFDIARQFGADVCYKPTPEKSAKAFLFQQEKWGVEYTFDATGNTNVMREALQSAHRGIGYSCIIGVAESDKFISTHSFQLVVGRKWIGTAFGGWKSVQDVPKLVNKALTGEWPIEAFVTHEFDGLDKVNESIDILRGGECLRAIIKISPPPAPTSNHKVRIVSSTKCFGGLYQVVSHWSEAVQGEMTFGIYIPEDQIKNQRGKPFPALYCLGGMGSTHENFAIKSGFGPFAKKHRIACIFPDTSPRKTGIPDIDKDWQFGESAGYYVDATSDVAKKNFRMFFYVNHELPEIVSSYFPVDRTNKSITGFSMGGHGALISAFKTGSYKSVSAFAPMSNPTKSAAWGIKGYKFFFAKPEQEGLDYDSTELVRSGKAHKLPCLIDLGSQDQFTDKLLFNNLRDALLDTDYNHIWKVRPGYNHSFWYVSTFLEEHFDFHAKYLL